jgi:hypothetical protein
MYLCVVGSCAFDDHTTTERFLAARAIDVVGICLIGGQLLDIFYDLVAPNVMSDLRLDVLSPEMSEGGPDVSYCGVHRKNDE